MTATSTRLGEAATAASEAVNATTDYVTKTTDRVRDELGTTERRAREIIEEYPLTCFFGAIVAGYLVGRVATRW
jgi:predicted transcriptional regulator